MKKIYLILSLLVMMFISCSKEEKTDAGSIGTVYIGDYLFRDGTWGSLAENPKSTPIAVIFSNTTSTTDQKHGWIHGYAMALKNAATNITWGSTTSNPTGTYDTTTTAMIADKDGYTKTTMINRTTYPAAYAATTYQSIVPTSENTSGWYLPSIGQWFDICVNLGGMSTTNYTDKYNSLYWSGQASTCTSNINAYLTPLDSTTYTKFSAANKVYLCSSENSNSTAYVVWIDDDNKFGNIYGHVYMIDYPKTSTYTVRSVIAF